MVLDVTSHTQTHFTPRTHPTSHTTYWFGVGVIAILALLGRNLVGSVFSENISFLQIVTGTDCNFTQSIVSFLSYIGSVVVKETINALSAQLRQTENLPVGEVSGVVGVVDNLLPFFDRLSATRGLLDGVDKVDGVFGVVFSWLGLII